MTYLQIRGNKYNNVSQVYGGNRYDSKKEAAYAQTLDLMTKAQGRDRIKRWERQVKISFDVDEDGKLVARLLHSDAYFPSPKGKLHHICNYYMDFLVVHMDDTVELVEVKGMETDVWKLKRTLVEATLVRAYPDEIKYTVIK